MSSELTYPAVPAYPSHVEDYRMPPYPQVLFKFKISYQYIFILLHK